MKNKLLLALSLSSLATGSVIHADGILPEIMKEKWLPVIGVGGGVSGTTQLGQSQTFPIINPVTDEYYVYSPAGRGQTQGLFEVFLGGEHPIFFKLDATGWRSLCTSGYI